MLRLINLKKKRKREKLEKLEASLEQDEGETESQGGKSDRGKRGEGSNQLQKLHQEEINRRQVYDSAVQAASSLPGVGAGTTSTSSSSATTTTSALATAAAIKLISTTTQPYNRVENVGHHDDDDAEIAESLARARRLALQLQQKEKAKEKAKEKESTSLNIAESKENDNSYEIAEKVRYTAQKFHPNQDVSVTNGGILGLDDENALDAEGRKKDGTLVFTSTTEFTTRLQARLQEKARSKAEAAMKDLNDSGSESEDEGQGNFEEKKREKSERVVKKKRKTEVVKQIPEKSGWVDLGNGDMEVVGDDDEQHQNNNEEEYGEDEEEDEDEEYYEEENEVDGNNDNEEEVVDEQLGFLHKQPLVATGMAATLQLLKGTGDLQTKEELAGRAKDARDRDPSKKDYGVVIEYRDDLGRKLTQKEAFRQISYRFHGFGPGIKKREKRLRV